VAVGAKQRGGGVSAGGGVIDDENGGHGEDFLFIGGLSKSHSEDLLGGGLPTMEFNKY